ncbi:MAG: O-antigen ligase family protein [Calditrichaeota bacterium]|nr:O-antigen ligase family protein [Calditrichota bacterium]
MSASAAIFLLFYVTGLIMTFRNPYYGVLTYMFHWYNHPPYYWWGDEVPDFVGGRWSLVIALATLASWIIHRQKMAPLEKPSYQTSIWLGLMVINMLWVSVGVAVMPDLSMDKAVEVLKVMISFLLIASLVRTYKDYKMMIWLLILWTSYWGFVAWDVGGNRDIGVVAPNATEENAVSAHVMALMPFFGVYFLNGNRWGKALVVLGVPFCINLIILANSRATLLGFAAIGMLSVFLFKGKVRFAAILAVLVAGFLFMHLTNEDFKERQSTETYDDGSATSRFHIWEGAWEMWKAHPFGVGGGGFIELSTDYISEIDESKSQHNTFVAVGTDWGFFGLFFYLAFLAHTFIVLARIKRTASRMPAMAKYSMEATAVQLALMGLIGAGFFHSRQYAEVVYWLCAFALMLQNIMNTEIDQMQKELNKPISVDVEDGTPIISNPVSK